MGMLAEYLRQAGHSARSRLKHQDVRFRSPQQQQQLDTATLRFCNHFHVRLEGQHVPDGFAAFSCRGGHEQNP